MREYKVEIRVFSDNPFIKSVTFYASNLRELDEKLRVHADTNEIKFDIVFISVIQEPDYKPLPF